MLPGIAANPDQALRSPPYPEGKMYGNSKKTPKSTEINLNSRYREKPYRSFVATVQSTSHLSE